MLDTFNNIRKVSNLQEFKVSDGEIGVYRIEDAWQRKLKPARADIEALIASWNNKDKKIERLREVLEDFVSWSEAYPTDIFSVPDYKKAHELLLAGGMTLDSISASIMRRATEMIGKRSRAALEEMKEKE